MGLFLLMPWVVHAAGLGKLTILSALGQPLLAEVDLVSVRIGELATLVARVAPPEAYAQANISYSPALVGVRMSTERRADGQAYIKIISTRPVNEPFIDLLVELSWPQGRLVREYTALIDPVGYTPATPVAAVVPSVVVSPPATPETQLIAPPQPPVAAALPVEAKPAATKARPVKPAAAAEAANKAYGPVKRGETLARIASKVKPEGVTLEQMLVTLYHANPDAFGGNMNLLKTGKILRVPEKERVIATGQSEAVKEVRVEAADWNVYRRKLAEAAGETAARESKSGASGKITAKVEDKSVGEVAPKEVLKLSKGESAAGKARGGKLERRSVPNRIRMLEEEAIAREKALADANNRIAQLEKTIKDMQRVIEIKAQAPVAKPALPPPPPSARERDLIGQITGEPAYLAAAGGVLALAGLGGYLFVRRRTQAGSDERVGDEIEPETGRKAATAGDGVLALLGGYLSVLRRRVHAGGGEADRERIAPELGESSAAVAAVVSAESVVEPTPMPVADGTEDVDPLAEADMYLNFGRDAQAENVLKAALEKTPTHEEAQLKLLQVYAGRKDKAAFEKIACTLHAQTKGTGDSWLKAAAMGYAFDPANALYEAGKSATVATPVVGGVGADFDFNFGVDTAPAAGVAKTDFSNAPVAETGKTSVHPGEIAGAAVTQPPAEPDVTPDMPRDGMVKTDIISGSDAPTPNMIDFSFDALAPVAAPGAELADNDSKGGVHDGIWPASSEQPHKAAEPEPGMEFSVGDQPEKSSVKSTEAAGTGASMREPDFKYDFGGGETPVRPAPEVNLDEISLNFEEGPAAELPKAEGGARDDHWYDVQAKFDLARAYQEMGDKSGARAILQEVIKGGDAGQRAAAQKLLASLD